MDREQTSESKELVAKMTVMTLIEMKNKLITGTWMLKLVEMATK